MAGLFLLNGPKPSVAVGVKLVKADQASVFLSALELADKIRQMEDELALNSKEVYEARRADGYRDGLAAGRDEYSLKIMDTVMASVEYLERLEGDLAGIVEEAVRKIIGSLPPHEVAVDLVRKALTTLRSDRRVLVRVSPADEPAVREALLGPKTGGTAFLDIRADARLSQGECVLESELGVVEASLETQLKNLSKALRARVNMPGG